MGVKTLGKGIGTTYVKIRDRILELFHDDAGYINLGGKRFVILTSAITPNSTTTSHPVGSFAITTHATGRLKLFVSDGTYWQKFLLGTSKMCGHVVWGAVPAATTSAAATQLDLNAVAEPSNMASVVQPTVPRNVVVNFTDANASITDFDFTVHGKAPDGTTISENFVFAGGLDQVGSKIFASITNFTLNSIAGNASGDLLDIGYGTKLGVPVPYGATNLTVQNLRCDTTVEAASATDATNNSITPTTAPNGTRIFQAWFSYDFPA